MDLSATGTPRGMGRVLRWLCGKDGEGPIGIARQSGRGCPRTTQADFTWFQCIFEKVAKNVIL
jgi:hypothetical protein